MGVGNSREKHETRRERSEGMKRERKTNVVHRDDGFVLLRESSELGSRLLESSIGRSKDSESLVDGLRG